jgi:hypothetical protein
MADTLGSLMASLMPTRTVAKCPKCDGRLIATVTLYANVPVYVETSGIDKSKRALYGGKIVETKAALAAQASENYEDVPVDVRDDLCCERFNVDGGCDYWTCAIKLET